jgi:predicted nicotinamide N-methyase
MDDVVEHVVPLPGRELLVLAPRDGEALLSEGAFEHEEFLPYWAELWPSAVALARVVARRPLTGRRVLELGAGLGLPALAAAAAGGRVLATDWAADAVEMTARNAAHNGLELATGVFRWDADPAPLGAPWPLVLASDVLYERRNLDDLLDLLPRLVDERGLVLLADPGRAHSAGFLERASENGWIIRSIASPRAPRVSIHRLRRG